jgi:hypothetical protein
MSSRIALFGKRTPKAYRRCIVVALKGGRSVLPWPGSCRSCNDGPKSENGSGHLEHVSPPIHHSQPSASSWHLFVLLRAGHTACASRSPARLSRQRAIPARRGLGCISGAARAETSFCDMHHVRQAHSGKASCLSGLLPMLMSTMH